MKTSLLWLAAMVPLLAAELVIAHATPAEAPAPAMPAAGFAADNAQAMEKMMAAMSVASTGDTDRDFVATMVPHHQGAVDMALAELRYGKDETLRRMAQEIIVEQKQEIDAMQLASGRLADKKLTAPASAAVCRSGSMSSITRATQAPESH